MDDRYDVIIIGGGLVGSSIAWRLAMEGRKSVAVLDVDLAGHFSSSELNAGLCRTNWTRRVNIEMARRSVEFYEANREEVGFRQRGFLWLHDRAGWEKVRRAIPFQQALGVGIEEVELAEVRRRFPEIDGLDGVVAATFAPRDGIVNTNALKQYYRSRGKAAGVTFLDHHMVTEVTVDSPSEVTVKASVFDPGDDPEEVIERVLTTHKPPAPSTERVVKGEVLVNAAGPWARPVAALWGDDPPTEAVRRQICLVHSKDLDLGRYGVVVAPDGTYCHPEAGHVLVGCAGNAEPPGFSFRFDGSLFFTREVWPRLVRLFSRFERARYMGGWASLVGVTPDGSGLLGRAGDHANVYEAVGFAGREAVQSYAIGVAMADLILHGRPHRIDASDLDRRRFLQGRSETEDVNL